MKEGGKEGRKGSNLTNVSGSSPLGHSSWLQSCPIQPGSHTQPYKMSASQTETYSTRGLTRSLPSHPDAASAIERHLPCPEQADGHSTAQRSSPVDTENIEFSYFGRKCKYLNHCALIHVRTDLSSLVGTEARCCEKDSQDERAGARVTTSAGAWHLLTCLRYLRVPTLQ